MYCGIDLDLPGLAIIRVDNLVAPVRHRWYF